MSSSLATIISTLASMKVPALNFKEIKNIQSDWANWVVPRRIMTGPSPLAISSDEGEIKTNMEAILADGIDTFVCLQSESSPEDYKKFIPAEKRDRLVFVQYPIDDHTVPSHKDFTASLSHIIGLLRDGRNIYVHCQGGHGRTGTYVVALLACLYPELRKDKSLALHYFQSVHDMRRKQILHFFGLLPARVAENRCQQDLLDDFFVLLRFLF